MLPFKIKNRLRVSNRMAIFAGIMLIISSLAGMNHATPNQASNGNEFADGHPGVQEQPAITRQAKKRADSKKGFKVSLFLFRLN